MAVILSIFDVKMNGNAFPFVSRIYAIVLLSVTSVFIFNCSIPSLPIIGDFYYKNTSL